MVAWLPNRMQIWNDILIINACEMKYNEIDVDGHIIKSNA